MKMDKIAELNRITGQLRFELDGADEVHAAKLSAFFDKLYVKVRRIGQIGETLEAERATLLAVIQYADTRAVSVAAAPHASTEDRKLRELIDAALETAGDRYTASVGPEPVEMDRVQ